MVSGAERPEVDGDCLEEGHGKGRCEESDPVFIYKSERLRSITVNEATDDAQSEEQSRQGCSWSAE